MLIALSMLIFLLLRLTPGDPIDAYIDPNIPMSPAQLTDCAASSGSTSPCQCNIWRGCSRPSPAIFGYSIKRQDQPVLGLVLSRIGPTVLLMGIRHWSSPLSSGIVTGVVSAVRRNSADGPRHSRSFALVGISSPAFLSALIGLYVFCRAAAVGAVRRHADTRCAEFSVGDLLAI